MGKCTTSWTFDLRVPGLFQPQRTLPISTTEDLADFNYRGPHWFQLQRTSLISTTEDLTDFNYRGPRWFQLQRTLLTSTTEDLTDFNYRGPLISTTEDLIDFNYRGPRWFQLQRTSLISTTENGPHWFQPQRTVLTYFNYRGPDWFQLQSISDFNYRVPLWFQLFVRLVISVTLVGPSPLDDWSCGWSVFGVTVSTNCPARWSCSAGIDSPCFLFWPGASDLIVRPTNCSSCYIGAIAVLTKDGLAVTLC